MGVSAFRVLGPIEAWSEETRLPLGGPQQMKLLAFLLLNANRAVSADAVIDAVWGPGRDGGLKRLQMAIMRLRKALEPLDADGKSLLQTVGGGYLLSIASDELDAAVFAQRIQDGRRTLGDGDSVRAGELVGQALELWRGPPLAEVAFEDFVQAEIRRLHELRLVALETRIDADLQQGRHSELVAELEVLFGEQPTRERLAAQLMIALYRSGRQTDALEIYQRTRAHLADQLGLEPGPALRELQNRILKQDRTLSEPVNIKQQKTVGASPSGRRDNDIRLPCSPSTFVGRSSEVADVTALLRRGETRVLTLTGAGGIGKTRLALRVAAGSAGRYRDGAAFVGFAEINDPDLIVPAICEALRLDADNDVTRNQRLKDWLRPRELLLVLDNLEHLTAGTAVLGELLVACPALVLLVTSREPLHLVGEQQYEVQPLTYFDAVELFTQRAAAVAPHAIIDSEVVGKICNRLDALPLAIELAAARFKTLPIDEILARLNKSLPLLTGGPRDAPPRQRTLRATIDWSYELMNPEQRCLLIRLAVFAGGWTLPAAEAVCGADLETLLTLVDQSLVQRNGDRYSMLGTIREYALEQLERRGELYELQRLHHRWFASLVDEELHDHRTNLAAATRGSIEVSGWSNPSSTGSRERENIRAALLWALKERAWRGWKRG